MCDDEEAPGPAVHFPYAIRDLENLKEYSISAGESVKTNVSHTHEEDGPITQPVLLAMSDDSNEKVTVAMRFTYTKDSVLHTEAGRHLPYRVADKLVAEIVDSWLADATHLGHNLSEERFEQNIATTLEYVESRIRELQSGTTPMPILGIQVNKRSSRRPSPNYTLVPVQRDGETEVPTLAHLRTDSSSAPLRHAFGPIMQRCMVYNNNTTYYQKNTVTFSAPVQASLTLAPEGTYATGNRYGIRHTIHVSGAPVPPPPGASSEALGVVGGSPDTPVLLEEASEASESLSGPTESWDLTLS